MPVWRFSTDTTPVENPTAIQLPSGLVVILRIKPDDETAMLMLVTILSTDTY